MYCIRFSCLVLFLSPSLVSDLGGLVQAMGAMRVVVAAGEVVVGALVPILVPVVGLVQVAMLLLLLLLAGGGGRAAVGAALLLLLLLVGVGAALLVAVGAALLVAMGAALLVVVGAALLLLLLLLLAVRAALLLLLAADGRGGGGGGGGSTASDREYRNKAQGFSCYLFCSQQAKCTIWRVSRFYT